MRRRVGSAIRRRKLIVDGIAQTTIYLHIMIGQYVCRHRDLLNHYNGDCIFHADTCRIICEMTEQSRDIKQGVDEAAAEGKGTAEQGAGDQGLMFGFACNETPELMPAPISFAHKLGRELTRLRKESEIPWLRPDAKTQVSIEYNGHKPVRASAVVVSTQHAADVKQKEIRETLIELLIKKV